MQERWSRFAILLCLAGLAAAMACSPASENASSTSQPLNSVSDATYNNVASGSHHFATTSTVTVIDNTCGGAGNNFRTIVAWEEEQAQGSATPTSIWIGSECGFNPPQLLNGGNARRVVSGIALPNEVSTGTPSQWNTDFPSQPMLWLKEPHVVVLDDPTVSGNHLIALVGIVGKQVAEYDHIAIALSTDSGQSWGYGVNPLPTQLVTTKLNGDGGGPSAGGLVDDLDVAPSYLTDVTGHYFRGQLIDSKFNSGTNDLFFTWRFANNRWFRIESYHLDPASNSWTLLNDPSINLSNKAPFEGQDIHAMSVVAGLTPPTTQAPFVAVQWPAVSTEDDVSAVDCSQGGPPPLPNQVWHGAMSYTAGGTWIPMPDSHLVTNPWPPCVGFMPGFSNYRNDPRSSLTFDVNSSSLIDAVAMPDMIDGVPGTYIEVNAMPLGLSWSPPGQPVLAFYTMHNTAQPPPQQDQFLPVVKADWQWNANNRGTVTVAWIDSVEDGTMQNQPSGVYGVTSTVFTPNDPACIPPAVPPPPGSNGLGCFVSGNPVIGGQLVGRIWPVPPAPATILGVPMNNGFDWDVLGRHNSLGVNGWSWLTFAGEWNGGSRMDTASVSPL